MCMNVCLCACIHTICMHDVCEVQKKVLDTLEPGGDKLLYGLLGPEPKCSAVAVSTLNH